MRRWLRTLCNDNIILIVATVLAVISCCIVHPDSQYASYVHVKTIAELISLMIVVCGMQRIGVFRSIGSSLLSAVHSQRAVVLCLVALPFFSAMFITNDVALVTFIPFAISVLIMAHMGEDTVLVCTLMTVAANMGSMLTPIGNAHNLYLKAISGLSTADFLALMAPYSALAAAMLLGLIVVIFSRRPALDMPVSGAADVERGVLAPQSDRARPDEIRLLGYGSSRGGWRVIVYVGAFLVCLLGVGDVIPIWAMLLIVIVAFVLCDKRVFFAVDWALPLTFIMFFIFIGNMRRVPEFSLIAQSLVGRHPLGVAVGFSQIISNVPTTLLLTGFSNAWKPLIVGTNLGGLGTLIASMASLVAYKNVTSQYPDSKHKYLMIYSGINAAFLLILVSASLVFGV